MKFDLLLFGWFCFLAGVYIGRPEGLHLLFVYAGAVLSLVFAGILFLMLTVDPKKRQQ